MRYAGNESFDRPRLKEIDESRETRLLQSALEDGWSAEEIAAALGVNVAEASKRAQKYVRQQATRLPLG